MAEGLPEAYGVGLEMTGDGVRWWREARRHRMARLTLTALRNQRRKFIWDSMKFRSYVDASSARDMRVKWWTLRFTTRPERSSLPSAYRKTALRISLR